jgi:integrase
MITFMRNINKIMSNRYRIYIRGKNSGGKVWMIQDNQTGKRESLRTTNKDEALQMLLLRNHPHRDAGFHAQMARTHILVSNPQNADRTWQSVMADIENDKKDMADSTKVRCNRAHASKPFDHIRNLFVASTSADDFKRVLKAGGVSTNMYLSRLHNYALGMNWLLVPIIAKNLWPQVIHKDQRAIKFEEHQRILERELNQERKAYYQICWHIGGSQTDMANLKAENIDWQNRTIAYIRQKTETLATLRIDAGLENLLRSLPATGNLFPYLTGVREADRATEFKQRCEGLNIKGVTLHSYRYAWAERAAAAGYPERFAQKALGHASKTVARAYAKNADVLLPSLESYERTNAQAQNN